MKILIGLIEHLGDIVACEPVPRYLKDKYQDSTIVWAVSPPYRELIDTNPFIDETLVVDCLTDWMKCTRHLKYDLLVDLHVNYRICPTCKIPLFKTIGNPDVDVHGWFDHGSLLEAFSVGAGLPRLCEPPRVYLQPRHAQAVDAWGLGDGYVVIHRQSNNPEKDWPDYKWDYVIERVLTDLGLPVVEVGSGDTADPGLMHDRYVNLVNRTGLLECAEVIRRAALFVGVDSGPAHLANAVDTKGVVLLGPLGHFKTYNPFCGGYGKPGRRVRLLRNRYGPVRELPREQVVQTIREMITPASPEVEGGGRRLWGTAKTASAAFGVRPGREPAGPASSPGKTEAPHLRVLAFYLPQFHPLPEAGGQEPGVDPWRAVLEAGPLFDGHAQPRLPGELGCYEGPLAAVLEKQVELAQQHGISGFCFYYYYRRGRPRLVQPLETFLREKFPLPFCLVWADPNRTGGRFRGSGPSVGDRQADDEDQATFFRTLLPLFRDDRYLKVNGKPLLLVEQPESLPDLQRAVEQWRHGAQMEGLKGIYLVRGDARVALSGRHPREIDFDAAYELPGNAPVDSFEVMPAPPFPFHRKFDGVLVDYEKFSRFHRERPFPEYKLFKTVMLPGDDTALSDNNAVIHLETDPAGDSFQKWLLHALLDTSRQYHGDERLLFVYSWNDWSTGTYLEPDQRNGRKFLHLTRDTVAQARQMIDLGVSGDVQPAALAGLARYLQEKDEFDYRMWRSVVRPEGAAPKPGGAEGAELVQEAEKQEQHQPGPGGLPGFRLSNVRLKRFVFDTRWGFPLRWLWSLMKNADTRLRLGLAEQRLERLQAMIQDLVKKMNFRQEELERNLQVQAQLLREAQEMLEKLGGPPPPPD